MLIANPYDRERALMPIAIQATRHGVRMDRELLTQYDETYSEAMKIAESYVKEVLQAPDLQLTSGKQLAAALDNAGAVTEQVFTEKGNRSTARAVLERTVADPELRDNIIYFNTIRKSRSDFITKWLKLSEADGRVHPNWNQVKARGATGDKGARTGRFSCDSPNLQNPPNEYNIEIPEGYPEPPVLRRAFLPEEGHVWLKRDFSGQEIRIAAHFEDGVLLEAYTKNPSLDPHSMVQELIHTITGLMFERKHVKITGFQIMYGGGPRAVSEGVGCSYKEAITLIEAYLTALPGVAYLQKDTKRIGYRGHAITTWGGRKYRVEPPKVVKGRKMSFEYKLLNYLIQGSAADQTKQCIIDWHHEYRKPGDIFLATVHDEINISAPEEHWEESMSQLRLAMDQDLFDCPMRSEGFMGPNWADIKEAT